MNRRALSRIISRESTQWLNDDIISPEQKQRIDSCYEISTKQRFSIQTIIFALAAVLIGTGIILFYAANWQSMHPAAKFSQIIIIIAAFYAGGYFIAFKKNQPLIGLTLIRVGALAYGAGIGLTAQIFHLSAHPSGAFLLWGISSLVLAFAVKDGGITILSLISLSIWHIWQTVEFSHLNITFFLLLGVCAAAMTVMKMRRALVLTVIALAAGYFATLAALFGKNGDTSFTLALFIIPFAALLLVLSNLPENEVFGNARALLRAGGIALLYAPLIALSWPYEYFTETFPLLAQTNIAIAYFVVCALAAMSAACCFFRKKISLQALLLSLSPAVITFLPLGNMSCNVTIFNVILIAFLVIVPFFLSSSKSGISAEIVTFILLFATIVIKSWGFLGEGFASQDYTVAYGCGVLIFLSIMFLLHIAQSEGLKKNITLLTIVTAVFITLYSLSFTIDNAQRGILFISPVVFPLLVTFLAAGVVLHAALFTIAHKKEIPLLKRFCPGITPSRIAPLRIPLYCSLIIFSGAVLLLFVANEAVSPLFYSISFNTLLFGFTALLLWYAYKSASERIANLAIAAFIIHILTRYFDTFFDLRAGALLFIITGFIFLAGGIIVEKTRRSFLSHLKTMKANSSEDEGE